MYGLKCNVYIVVTLRHAIFWKYDSKNKTILVYQDTYCSIINGCFVYKNYNTPIKLSS